MPRDDVRVPDYLVERLAAGDLPAIEEAALRERLAREPNGAARLAALSADDAAVLERHPPRVVAAEVLRRTEPRPPRSLAWRIVPALAAAAAVLVAIPLLRPDDGERMKGFAPRLVLHRRTTSGAEILPRGATARTGDLVQIGYVAAGAAYGAIVSVDGAGAVTRHFPESGDEAALLTSGREVLLAESFRLDDAPGYERFVFVTSPRPFPVESVLDAARRLAARPDAGTASLSLPDGLAQASVLLLKEAR